MIQAFPTNDLEEDINANYIYRTGSPSPRISTFSCCFYVRVCIPNKIKFKKKKKRRQNDRDDKFGQKILMLRIIRKDVNALKQSKHLPLVAEYQEVGKESMDQNELIDILQNIKPVLDIQENNQDPSGVSSKVDDLKEYIRGSIDKLPLQLQTTHSAPVRITLLHLFYFEKKNNTYIKINHSRCKLLTKKKDKRRHQVEDRNVRQRRVNTNRNSARYDRNK
ncbi:hypothetical protein RFI_35131 [Reticulomyxa filosa]|uniref:Uncharacterized protein n=1 Tax=Reticulomyxa filosa TaxID=46433 RepID=X6LLS1_RETFI|nr:hypothetical protein RFI_35131 [Reticulomyxa filosa]|eukprot:ETO02306.1 hypothetical protein RFI_35131 [Reticulomyxa filosa]